MDRLQFGDKVAGRGRFQGHYGIVVNGIAIHSDIFPYRVRWTKPVDDYFNGEYRLLDECFVKYGEFEIGWNEDG